MATRKNFCRFSRNQDDMLIRLISSHPALYDSTHPLYKDLIVKDNIWREISESVAKSVEECKIRWRSIRDLYNRKKKEAKKNPNMNRMSKWEYMDQLVFLERAAFKRMIAHNIADVENQNEAEIDAEQDIEESVERDCNEEDGITEDNGREDNPSCEQEESATNPIEPEIKIVAKRKRKKTAGSLGYQEVDCRAPPFLREYQEPRCQDRDPISLFFRSMAQTVMSFPPPLATEAKIRVCRVITDLEFQHYMSQASPYPQSEESSTNLMRSPEFDCKTTEQELTNDDKT